MRLLNAILIALLYSLCAFSCKTTSITRIDDSGISYEYSIDQTISAHPIGWAPVRIFVNSDTICAVAIIETGEYRPYTSWKYYKTIKGLFKEITRLDTACYEIRVTMDNSNQYPQEIFYKSKPCGGVVSDESCTIATTNYFRKR